MNEGTRNQLKVKLKKMLDHLDQGKAKQRQPRPQPGIGDIIRRRKGERDKRFFICRETGSCAVKRHSLKILKCRLKAGV